MKTEKEIREEIEASKRTINNHQEAYKQGKIPKEALDYAVNDNHSTISTLLWVLGENDRYD